LLKFFSTCYLPFQCKKFKPLLAYIEHDTYHIEITFKITFNFSAKLEEKRKKEEEKRQQEEEIVSFYLCMLQDTLEAVFLNSYHFISLGKKEAEGYQFFQKLFY